MVSGFSYNEIPELCGTLPTLELCYSMSQRFLDEHQPPSKTEELAPEPAAVVPPSSVQPIPNWKISSRRDIPDEVKARLSTGRRRCRATQFILRPGVFVHVLIADNGLTGASSSALLSLADLPICLLKYGWRRAKGSTGWALVSYSIMTVISLYNRAYHCLYMSISELVN